MRAVLRSAHSSDVDLDTYEPEDPTDDGVWVSLMVGPADGPGEESFDVLVCTPLWLRRVVTEQGPRVGRHHLIVEPLDLGVAVDFLRNQINSVEGPDWPTVGEKIARLGYWEFEDYRPRP
ncbi:hypothetical protein SAT01_20470 [Sinomonas atrocyanea]|uniref:immunity 8 family protein n=1 Tax=Sinomonas atrocyanea TaxID=37927 RepID=UPI00082E0B5E|nr:immunity 8 family protein [Sinomonas atrocyanea]GEB64599.1 hypothetical protein SAT01_20470 [Sinomonas atrocyanea]GGG81407.1 hypothetical protein GCM10007172_38530 [Sinomonas atrocyanea]